MEGIKLLLLRRGKWLKVLSLFKAGGLEGVGGSPLPKTLTKPSTNHVSDCRMAEWLRKGTRELNTSPVQTDTWLVHNHVRKDLAAGYTARIRSKHRGAHKSSSVHKGVDLYSMM